MDAIWRRQQPAPRMDGGLLVVALSTLVAVRPVVGQAKPEEAPDLSAVRSALEKYKDPYVAIHDGYFSTLGCIEIGRPGGRRAGSLQAGWHGVHFLNTSHIGPVPDPAKPQVLIYEPDGNKLRLVAAEWFIPLATGVKEHPTLWNHPFDGPMTGHPPCSRWSCTTTTFMCGSTSRIPWESSRPLTPT